MHRRREEEAEATEENELSIASIGNQCNAVRFTHTLNNGTVCCVCVSECSCDYKAER